MGRERDDQYVLEVDRETTFGTTPAGAALRLRVQDVDLTNLDTNPIENTAYQTSGGSHGFIPGLAKCVDSAVSFSQYVEGLGTAAGDAATPTATATSYLFESSYQVAADIHDGAKAEAGASTTSITEDVGTHVPTGTHGIGTIGNNGSGSLVYEVFPYTDGGSDTLTVLMALDDAPSLNDVIYGDIIYPFTQSYSGSVVKSNELRFVGNSTSQHAYMYGQVGTFEIADVGPAETPMLNWSVVGTDYLDLQSDSRTAATNNFATVMAGGSFHIAGYGSTVKDTMCAARIAIHGGGAFQADLCGGNSTGVAGFTRTVDPPTITVTIPLTEAPPAAITASTYREAYRNNQVSGNDLHFMCRFGTVPGRIWAMYLPQCRVTDWKRVSDGGVAMQSFTLLPVDGISEMAVVQQS